MSLKKILIIEDSPTTRAVIKVYLVGQALEFLEATDGVDGLEVARRHHPAVIVVDLKMPKMDGFTFCRTIRADAHLKDTPVIVLTGAKGEAIRHEALAAGATFFMNKPIDSKELAERIVSCVEGG